MPDYTDFLNNVTSPGLPQSNPLPTNVNAPPSFANFSASIPGGMTPPTKDQGFLFNYLPSQGAVYGTQLLQGYLPYLNQSVNQTTGDTAQANLNAAQQVSPGYQQLANQLLAQYGPQLFQTGNQLSGINAQGNAANQQALLQGTGGQNLALMNQYAQALNPAFYQQMGNASNSLTNLLGSSQDVSGNLTGSETRSIGQGLAQQSNQRGTLNSPSNSDIVSNAMQYGNASFQRQAQEKGILSNAIGQATSFLPQAQTGFSPNFINSTTSPGSAPANLAAGQFGGVQQQNGSQGLNLANTFLNGYNTLANTGLGAYSNQMLSQAANKGPSTLDKIQQGVGIAGGIVNVAGGIFGSSATGGLMGCWVAREVYGDSNPKWRQFRHWLFTYSPIWFRDLYLQEGKRFAKFISNKPWLKKIVKWFMDSKIKN